jgi:glycosyltransferase involved in cell wall biosynthesis
MNVLIVAQQSIALVAGGPHIQVMQTVRHLPESGVGVRFFDQWAGIRREEIDLAHVFGANIMTYDIAVRLEHFGIPFVVSSIFFTQHSPAFVRMARNLEMATRRIYSGVWTDYGLSSAVCAKGRMVLPNSSAEAEQVHKGLGIDPSRIRVIPNGVEDRFDRADPRPFVERYGLRDFVLNVGHIGSPRKNVLAFIRAMASIDRDAVIIGKVHRNAYAEECLSEARKNPRMTIIEGLPNDSEMLASAYAACDTFALPSLYETPGIAALEAALAGAKIVITKYGGTVDYFEDMATYIEPHDVGAIARGIETSLRSTPNPALRQRMRDHYLWQKVAAKTASAYRDVLAGL